MTITYGKWVYVYPCKECEFMLGPSDWSNGNVYNPCPICGGQIGAAVPARPKYQEENVEKRKFFGLIKYTEKIKHFITWEKR